MILQLNSYCCILFIFNFINLCNLCCREWVYLPTIITIGTYVPASLIFFFMISLLMARCLSFFFLAPAGMFLHALAIPWFPICNSTTLLAICAIAYGIFSHIAYTGMVASRQFNIIIFISVILFVCMYVCMLVFLFVFLFDNLQFAP